jgi:hypothetical protein
MNGQARCRGSVYAASKPVTDDLHWARDLGGRHERELVIPRRYELMPGTLRAPAGRLHDIDVGLVLGRAKGAE